MPRPLLTQIILAPGQPPGQQLPPLPTSPSWDALEPDQRARLLGATPLVLSVVPGRTVLLALDPEPGATSDRTEVVDLRNLASARQPGAFERAERLASQIVARQISKLEDQHGHTLATEEREELARKLADKATWSILLPFDPSRAPSPSAWLLSWRGPMNNAIRAAVRASSRRRREAAKKSSPPPARASRAKPVDLDPLVLACRAGMLAHLGAAPLALALLHQGQPPKALASDPATYRTTRRRLEAMRQQAKVWARRNGYEATHAARAFPARCPRYLEPTGAATVEALRELESSHRAAAWADRQAGA